MKDILPSRTARRQIIFSVTVAVLIAATPALALHPPQ